jgi:hypothetical protein
MPINILSWNISWEAMTGTSKLNMKPLVGRCGSKLANNLNQCGQNVVNYIDTSPINYDFVAFQEASKWWHIYNNSTKLKTMDGYVHHKQDKSELVTFYDSKKYQLQVFKTGNINVNESTSNRPYHILYLTGKSDGQHYIFINLHNEHHLTKDKLEAKISENMNHVKIPTSQKIQNAETIPVTISHPILWSDNYNLIVAGDFNDHSFNDCWKHLTPFLKSSFPQLSKLTVKVPKQPPNTCCDVDRKSLSDKMYGDYILVSDSLKIIKDNYISLHYNPDSSVFPTSDHIPIQIELDIISPVTTTPQIKTSFALVDRKTLRLLNDDADPNDIKFQVQHLPNHFQGNHLMNNDKVIYPCGNITGNNFVLVYASNDPNKIGYINKSDLIQNGSDFKLDSKYITETLRLQDNKANPNKNYIFNDKPFKGLQVNTTDILKYACGEKTDKGLVLVQKENDTNTIGYLKIGSIQSGGEYKEKYIKYKTKYLNLLNKLNK